MTFEEILDHAIAMLQRRGRLTYSTLKRQFQLDAAALDDLKEQLLYAHPQVVDDAGRGLVWTRDDSILTSPGVLHSAVMRLYEDLVHALLQREDGSRIAPSHSSLALTRRAWTTCGRNCSSNSSPATCTARFRMDGSLPRIAPTTATPLS